jgi:hypothetical protein
VRAFELCANPRETALIESGHKGKVEIPRASWSLPHDLDIADDAGIAQMLTTHMKVG